MFLFMIDGREMKEPQKAQELLQETLSFPSWYGKNLDALWDQISTEDRWMTVKILYGESMLDQLGEYGGKLKTILEEGSLENPRFFFQWYPQNLYGQSIS